MSQLLKAVYKNGAFVLTEPCDLAEGAEAIVLVGQTMMREPEVTDPEERRRGLEQLVKRMRENPLPAGSPRFTRDELHERR